MIVRIIKMRLCADGRADVLHNPENRWRRVFRRATRKYRKYIENYRVGHGSAVGI